MHSEYGDEVQFVGIGVQADLDSVQAWIAEYGVDTFPHIHDADGGLQARFGGASRSTFYFLNDDGSVVSTAYGSVDESGLREQVENLIAN